MTPPPPDRPLGRDFAAEIAGERCWDAKAEFHWRTRGVPAVDALLQNRDEVVLLCEWIEHRGIRSYLEIGIWTGRLLSVLHRLFAFEKVAGCDLGSARALGLPVHVPAGAELLRADSHSREYLAWRERIGAFDLVLLDGDHSYEGVRRDFEINRALPHRFLAFHDIANSHPHLEGVRRLWGELGGYKLELVRPLPVSRWRMGIGIWSEREDPAAPAAGG